MLIVFFDSNCGVCNTLITWILKKDKKNQFKFSSLYGEFANITLSSIEPNYLSLNSVIVINSHTKKKMYIKFEAILEILTTLYPILKIFKRILLLKPFLLVGNTLYDLFANSKLRKQILKKNCILSNHFIYENKFIK